MTDPCPIWNNDFEAERKYVSERDINFYDSKRAGGKFYLEIGAICIGCPDDGCSRELDGHSKAKLTTYISERQDDIDQLIIDQKLIRDIALKKKIPIVERSNALLKYLASKVEYLSGITPSIRDPHSMESFELQITTQSINIDEVGYLFKFLEERSLIESRGQGHSIRVPRGRITAKGYTLLEELEKVNINSNKVFVAMWFNPQTEMAWSAIESAITQCGFEPVRIDKQDFNGDICDEIIGQINQSKFIVADFTAGFYDNADRENSHIPRGGVYFEAGYAKGLGLEIIFTCKHDCLDYIHFDTQQNNHIRWENTDDLKHKLINRIRATILKPK